MAMIGGNRSLASGNPLFHRANSGLECLAPQVTPEVLEQRNREIQEALAAKQIPKPLADSLLRKAGFYPRDLFDRTLEAHRDPAYADYMLVDPLIKAFSDSFEKIKVPLRNSNTHLGFWDLETPSRSDPAFTAASLKAILDLANQQDSFFTTEHGIGSWRVQRNNSSHEVRRKLSTKANVAIAFGDEVPALFKNKAFLFITDKEGSKVELVNSRRAWKKEPEATKSVDTAVAIVSAAKRAHCLHDTPVEMKIADGCEARALEFSKGGVINQEGQVRAGTVQFTIENAGKSYKVVIGPRIQSVSQEDIDGEEKNFLLRIPASQAIVHRIEE